jgi:hypothetical protein
MNQNQDSSGMYKMMAALGKAIGLAAAILGTPAIFEATKAPLFAYLARVWGNAFAEVLVWIMGAIEAFVLYGTVSFLFTAGLMWAVTTLVMRQFKD